MSKKRNPLSGMHRVNALKTVLELYNLYTCTEEDECHILFIDTQSAFAYQAAIDIRYNTVGNITNIRLWTCADEPVEQFSEFVEWLIEHN